MTAAPSPLAEPAAGTASGSGELLPMLQQALAALRRRARIGIATEAAGVLLLALLGYALLTLVLDRNLRLEVPVRGVLLLAFVAGAARIAGRRLLRPLRVPLGDEEMAMAVERQAASRRTPLQEALISSMQFEHALSQPARGESAAMMRMVIADVRQRFAMLPFAQALDAARVRKYAALAGVCALAFVVWGAADGPSLRLWALRNLALSAVEWPRYTSLQFVATDGDVVRLPQGDPLTVRVRVGGPVPDQVFLRSEFASGDGGVEPMSRTGDGEYTLTIETLIEDATLVAEGGDGVSSPLRIEIVERPRLESVSVQVVFPAYMQKEPESVPATEGEVRLLRGSELRLAGRSHKPLSDAFAMFGDRKVPLPRDADGHAFAGVVVPEASGVLVIDVIDRDRLGAGAPPRLQVRLVDDKPPSIDFKLRGISTLVTPQVRIPGDLKVKDDFGVTAVRAAFRAIDDAEAQRTPRAAGDPPPPEPPFVPIDAAFGDPLAAGAVRYESTAIVDLLPLHRAAKEDDPQNPVRPGMLLSLRFLAKDNFGPGDPHEAIGETFSFRVVTRDKLVEELRRRQVEQRMEVQRIRDEEAEAQLLLGQPAPAAGDPRAAKARAAFKALAARQQSLGRRVAFVGDVYQRILWEYENNRIWEPGKVREYEGLTAVPLQQLAREAFPATAHAVATFADTADEELRASAQEGYKDIIARLDAIMKVMEQVETLAALIEQLRGVIKVEDTNIREVERRLREAGQDVFRKPGEKPADKPGGK